MENKNTVKMKAVIATKYGSPEVLQIQEVTKPIPAENEICIKIHAASITRADCMMRTGFPYIGRLLMGFRKPKNPIPGTGFAGIVESIGKNVTAFKVGDAVYGESIRTFGTYAEYVCLAEDGILEIKPANISFEEAAVACDGALTSMNFLQLVAKVKSGQKVLINGASGSLGTAAVQLAKAFGAEVTGVCSSKNIELVKSLGADYVIAYDKTDITKANEMYDLIYDTVGKLSYCDCRRVLRAGGAYLSPVLGLPLMIYMLGASIFSKKKAKFSATGALSLKQLKPLFKSLNALYEAGKIKSIIDRSYQMSQIAEAQGYIETGHKKGNVVLLLKG